MKKILIICFIATCFLCSCSKQSDITGDIVEVNKTDETGMISFVVQTDNNEKTGIVITDETYIFSFSDEITADDFKNNVSNNVHVSVKTDGKAKLVNMNDQIQIKAYYADTIEVTGYLTDNIHKLSDGTELKIWQYSNLISYKLENGVELLTERSKITPENTYVAGTESLDDIDESAKNKIIQFYKNQGLIYDINNELEKAYQNYLDNRSNFQSFSVSQDTSPTASNENIMYFITTVRTPTKGIYSTEQRFGAAFDRKTGEYISNLDLFSCEPDEVLPNLLDKAKIGDSQLKREIEKAFLPEYITVFPDNIEINFPEGSLPSEEYSYIIGLDINDDILLNEWAVPQNRS